MKHQVLIDEIIQLVGYGESPVVYIGITGYARAGKDTVAELLSVALTSRGLGVVVRSLAFPIKTALTRLTGRSFHGDKIKAEPVEILGGITGRDAMISLGDWARSHNPNVFVEALKAAPLGADFNVVLVPDVRRKNEVARMDYIIRVTRPGVGPGANHPTEGELDDYSEDYLVENTGTLQELADGFGVEVPNE